jgi:uncharacterized protein (TIGR03067 family)
VRRSSGSSQRHAEPVAAGRRKAGRRKAGRRKAEEKGRRKGTFWRRKGEEKGGILLCRWHSNRNRKKAEGLLSSLTVRRRKGWPMLTSVMCIGFAIATAIQVAELRSLEGEWRVVSALGNPGRDGATVTIHRGEILYRMPFPVVRLGTVSCLFPVTEPKQMNVRRESETLPGVAPDDTRLAIYELRGNTLRLCINRPGTRRPEAFPAKASDADHGAEWFVLERVKK